MIRRFLQSAGITAIPVMTVCVFVPWLIYSGNPTEFTASFLELLSTYASYMLAIVAISGVLGIVMTNTGLRSYLAVMSALAILLWLQGNILVWDYGALDGRSIEWLSGVWRGVLDSAIWIFVILSAIHLHRGKTRSAWQGALAVFAIQSIAAGISLAGNDSALVTRSDVTGTIEAKEAVFRFSKTRNVVHIVMDGFQSDIFSAIMNDPAHVAYKDELQGFTFFQDNLGIFPYTQMTIPAMLSGNVYRNHMPVDEFINSSMADVNILDVATDAGFEVDIAAPVSLKNVYAKAKHANAYGISRSDHVTPADYIISDAARLLDLSLFRVLPHFAKALIHRDDLWVFQARVRPDNYLQMQYFSDLAFIRDLTQGLRVDRQTPVYKMMHFMLSHKPTVGDENCEYSGRQPTDRESVTIQANCGLKAIAGLLARMKEAGIYDNSLIILMADHGAWVPVEGIDASNSPDGIEAMTVAMAIPLLAIKRPGEAHEFRVSRAQVSILDVPATVAEVLGFEGESLGTSVFSVDPAATRQRLHYDYLSAPNKRHKGYLLPIQEFVVDGNVYDAASWRPGRRFLAENVVVEADSGRR